MGVPIPGFWPPGNYDPSWSPDDQWIIFGRTVEDTGGNAGIGIWHIFRVQPIGDGLEDLSLAGGHNDRAEYLPSYSPDGESIVFGSIYESANPDESHVDIFTMDANGGSLVRLVWIPLGN
jgi:Tol biopolymer transport system component